MDPQFGRTILETLRARDGRDTEVHLENGRVLHVHNIAWGYDLGDDFAHVTTNISPRLEGYAQDFFFIHEVRRLVDPDTGVVIIEQP